MRSFDYVVRNGGDEFLLLCPEADERTVQAIMDRIEKRRVDYNSGVPNPKLHLRLYKIGHAANKREDHDYKALFRSVDVALKLEEGSSR